MKTNSKFIARLLWVIVVAGLLLPGTVLTAPSGVLPIGGNKGVGNSCAKAANLKIDQRIADRMSKLQSGYLDRWSKVEQRRTNQEAKLAANRLKGDTNQEQQFAKLDDLAKTDAQKAAVEKFVAAVKAAIKIRQTAVDTAVKAFRAGADKAIEVRKTAVASVLDSYYKAVQTALEQAKADCAKGTNAAIVRTNHINAIKAAKTKLQTERNALDKAKTTIEGLAATRKAAIAKAVDDFQAAVRAARTEMQKAFAK